MPESLTEFAKKVVAAHQDKLRPRHGFEYEVAGDRPDLALYPEFDQNVTSGHFTDKYVKSPEYKKLMSGVRNDTGMPDRYDPPDPPKDYDDGIEIYPEEKFAGDPLSPLWNAADRFGQAHKFSPEEQMNVDAGMMRTKNNIQMFAEPKVFWMENNIPGASWVRKQLDGTGKPGG